MMRLLAHLAALLTVLRRSAAAGGDVDTTFQVADQSIRFQHLAADQASGSLYLGVTDALYQLDAATLKPMQRVRTGPELDSPFCNFNGECIESIQRPPPPSAKAEPQRRELVAANGTRVLTHNANQVLLVYAEHKVLIACGTLHQGVCSVHRLDDISKLAGGARVPVAANSANASTVAFIAPGPAHRRQRPPTLYVGATFTFGHYRDSFPAVSSRSLDEANLFQLVDKGDVQGQSGLVIKADNFPVHYVGGFYSDGFAYWAAVQKATTDANAPFQSKLLRVCAQDRRYDSYSELPLECLGGDNTKFNILRAMYFGKLGGALVDALPAEFKRSGDADDTEFLVGVFGKGNRPDKLQAGAAVCVFPIEQLRSVFWFNIQRCLSGVGYWNLPHFGMNQKCHNRTHLPAPTNECDLTPPVGGSLPATASAAIAFDDAALTAVAAERAGRATVLFLGTADGRLKKVWLKSAKRGAEYAEIQLSPRRLPIAADVLLADDGQHVYAMASNQLYKVRVAACERHASCDACMQSGDPYCGWCTLQNSCSMRVQCEQRDALNGYLSVAAEGDAAGCPRLLAPLQPQNASAFAAADTPVVVRLSALPPPTADVGYLCSFGDNDDEKTAAAFEPPATLTCRLPSQQARARTVPHGRDHVSVPLKLWSQTAATYFHQEPFIFYDCGASKLCTECLASRWPCDWCLLDNRCVDEQTRCSKQTSATNQSTCPHIDANILKESQILIASGRRVTVKLPVVNLDSIFDQGDSAVSLNALRCVVQVGNEEHSVGARLRDGGWVECDAHTYTYDSDAPFLDVQLFLYAGGRYIIDKAPVRLYKCHLLSPDCSRCQTLDLKYDCAWCSGRCQFKEFCPFSDSIERSDCPAPEIFSVHPLSGPMEGGTRVTIEGRELGSHIDDITTVTVAKDPCRVIAFDVSVKIVCETSAVIEPYDGRVAVKVEHNREAESKGVFRFVDVAVHSHHPVVGARSGGTRLTISGAHLTSGTSVRVTVGGVPCAVDAALSSGEQLVCTTAAAARAPWTADEIRVQIDAATRVLRAPFRFEVDPTVATVEPRVGFESGGRRLVVRGRHLNSILRPRIFLIDPIELRARQDNSSSSALPPLASDLADCTAVNSTVMWCKSPKLLRPSARVKREFGEDSNSKRAVDLSAYPSWPIGFLMDGVESVRNLGDRLQLTVVPDPDFFDFADKRKSYGGAGDEPLILDGRYLSLATRADEVSVFVGTEACNVTLLTTNQLVCQPPRRQPATLDGAPPVVRVVVGNVQRRLGTLAYASAGGRPVGDGSLNVFLLGGVVAVGAAILVLVFVCVTFWWRRKSWLAEKEYKRIQLQMNSLETNVRLECKQAFAELQTDISDLTSDLIALGIPFHTRRTYAAKVLFKDEHQAMMLADCRHAQQSGNGYSSQLHVALRQFESLLWNRPFVAQLVETLEQQPSFGAQDRVYVASLLTAALARNMQYCTEVVLLLLRQLIGRTVASKYPQLMLRRTESVVEKMLANWIALCLYDHLQDEAGSTLYLLYQALKHQIERGPVDAVTGEARYTLSEDRLLKEQIALEPLVVHVIPPVEASAGETIGCKVLSCDTISQVKEKVLDALYRNNPHSARPSIHDLDLEWRRTPNNQVALCDDDRPQQQSKDGWKRLNTLAAYGVPNNAILALNVRTSAGSACNSASSHRTCSSQNSSAHLIGNGHQSPENSEHGGVRYWHLVRPTSLCLSSSPSPPLTLGRRGRDTLNTSNCTLTTCASACATLPKAIPEIYLTRLLTSKGTVQKFVDDFFTGALRVCPQTFPPVIKYLFDFLENEAARHELADPSIVYAWKNNSLPLRFWVNVIKNPDFVFDVEKPATVDACLSVVAQTFMDACSPSEPRLGKDSPSNKLLFAKDIPRYRQLVSRFYDDVRALPPFSEQELGVYMGQLSKAYTQEFNVMSAVRELLAYVVKYRTALVSALDAQPACQKHGLADRLEQVLSSMGASSSSDYDEHVYAVVR